MVNENTQPSEKPVEVTEVTAQQQPAENLPPENQPATMAEIAKKYNLEQEIKQFTSQTQQPVTQAPSYSPTAVDPITDPETWNRLYRENTTQMNNTLRELTNTVSEMRQRTEQERLNVEVNKAVERVNQKLKIDPMYTEILLEKKYRDDPIFRRIWDNRHINPNALNEALEVISTEASRTFQVLPDPQLIENQRAAKASQKAMSSRTPTGQDDVMKLTDTEFDRWWLTNRR